MAPIWQRLGAPENAEGYGLALPDTATQADKDLLGTFTAAAAGAHMPKVFADLALRVFSEMSASELAKQASAAEATRGDGLAALRKEWGGAFDQNATLARNLARQVWGDDMAKSLDGEDIGSWAPFAKGLISLVERMNEPGGGGLMEGARGGGGQTVLTPAQAAAKVREIEANPAFRDPKHHQQKALLAQRNELLKQANAA
ncbi:MAG TPA: hypothetical protein VGF33_09970 [Caulobacteraceae bacterium]